MLSERKKILKAESITNYNARLYHSIQETRKNTTSILPPPRINQLISTNSPEIGSLKLQKMFTDE